MQVSRLFFFLFGSRGTGSKVFHSSVPWETIHLRPRTATLTQLNSNTLFVQFSSKKISCYPWNPTQIHFPRHFQALGAQSHSQEFRWGCAISVGLSDKLGLFSAHRESSFIFKLISVLSGAKLHRDFLRDPLTGASGFQCCEWNAQGCTLVYCIYRNIKVHFIYI